MTSERIRRSRELWANGYRYRLVTSWRDGELVDLEFVSGNAKDSGKSVREFVGSVGLEQACHTLAALAPRENWKRGLNRETAIAEVVKWRKRLEREGFTRQ
jgi:hypothetical protein